MATQYSSDLAPTAPRFGHASLGDSKRTILGPRRDALLFWGAPLAAFLLVQAWLRGWGMLAPPEVARAMVIGMFGFVSVLTWAHLIAVVPRAYLNPEVFATYRLRLTVVPVLLIAALFVSSTALVFAGVLAVFWDVHHSAMQNFGFARIYDMKAGNPPYLLRSADLRLNWILYVGPLAAGAALAVHADYFLRFDGTLFDTLTTLPGIFAARHDGIRLGAMLLYAAVLAWTGFDYARAIRAGYRVPAHKLATLATTGLVSVLAWGFSPPLVALAVLNLYHAVQYFALVWVKEGPRMVSRIAGKERAALIFFVGSGVFGFGYMAAAGGTITWLLAPFVACSLLHFWYDSFVWSVRKRQV